MYPSLSCETNPMFSDKARHPAVSQHSNPSLLSVLACLVCMSSFASAQITTPAPAGVLYIQVLINGTSYWKAFNFSSVAGTFLGSDTFLDLVAIPNTPPAERDDSLRWWHWCLIGGAFLVLFVILGVVIAGFYISKPGENSSEQAPTASGAYCKVIQVDLMTHV
jgi:hypothetical protein